MIVLRRIKGMIGLDLGDDRRIEHPQSLELGNVGLGDLGLLRVRGKDRRAILAADIRSLAVELGWIVCHRKEDLQNAAEADALGIVGNSHRFRVPRGTTRDLLISGGVLVTSSIARDGTRHTVDVLKHALDAPEAPPGKHNRVCTALPGGYIE